MLFVPLRQALEAQRDQIAERLEAIDEAEAALARMAEAFGMAPGPSQGRQDARQAVDQPTTSAEPASPAGGAAATEQRCICARCGATFSYRRRGGPERKFCSKACGVAAATAKRKARQANGEATGEQSHEPSSPPPPEPQSEQRECDYCTLPFTPSQPDQRFCSKDCKLRERRDRRGFSIPGELCTMMDDEAREDAIAN